MLAGFDVSGGGDVLTDTEVETYQPIVAQFFLRVGVAVDYGITHLNREHAESDIWMLSEEEGVTLARFYLHRARAVGWMARVARQIEHAHDLGDGLAVAQIVGKRIVASPLFIASHGGIAPWL